MIVTCPKCSKRYMLDDELLPRQGRQVRCISCLYVWRQEPHHIPVPRNLSPEPLHIDRGREKGFAWVKWSFGLIVLFVFVLGGGLYLERSLVVEHYPKARRIYALLGISLNSHHVGLDIYHKKVVYNEAEDNPTMVISGDLKNTSNQVKSIPPLKIKLMGDSEHPQCHENGARNGCVVDEWDHRLSESFLLPGESIHFETDPHPKVEKVKDVLVEF